MKLYKKSLSTYVIAGGIIFLILWFGIGTFFSSPPPQQPSTEHPLFAVSYIDSAAITYPEHLVLNGQTAPNQTIILAPEVDGLVNEILIPAGQYVAAGTPLLTIAPDGKNLMLKSSQADLDEARLKLKAAEKLTVSKYLSEAGLKAAKANFIHAQSQLQQARLAVKKITVTAPFSGVVARYQVELGSYLNPRAPNTGEIGSFVQLDPLKIIANVNQYDYAALNVGQPAIAKLITGEELKGTLTLLSPVADPQTRTYQIEATMSNPDHKIPAGMSASLILEKSTVQAHKIPPSLLVLSKEGTLGIRAVSPDNTVLLYPVNIIAADPTTFWVTGLPDQVRIISVGQDFVIGGEKVIAQPDTTSQEEPWKE